MNITSTTVRAFTITITEDEVREYIDNPEALTYKLKAILNGAYDAEAKPKKLKAMKGEHHPKEECPKCGRMIAYAWLESHQRKCKGKGTANAAE